MLSSPRRLTAIGVFAGIVGLAFTGGFAWMGFAALRDSKGRAGAVNNESVKDQFPDTPALLMVQTGDSDNALSGVTVMVETPKSGGWIIDLPVDTLLPAGGIESGRLVDVFKKSGKAGLKEAVEGLLRVTLDDDGVAVLSRADLTGVVARWAPASIRLARPIQDRLGHELYPVGVQDRGASELSFLLTQRPAEQSPLEIQDLRLEIFRAILGDKDLAAPAAAPSASAKATTASSTTIAVTTPNTAVPGHDVALAAGFLTWIRSGKHSLADLCRDGESPCKPAKDGSITLFDPRLRLIVAESMPGRVNDLGQGVKLRVISHQGEDSEAVLLHAAEKGTSFAAGVLVSATKADGPAPAVTQYLYSDDSMQASAEFMKQFLGPGEVKKDPQAIYGVDVVVVLGNDFAESYKREAQQSTTTTATTTSPTSQSSTSVKKSSNATSKQSATTRRKSR